MFYLKNLNYFEETKENEQFTILFDKNAVESEKEKITNELEVVKSEIKKLNIEIFEENSDTDKLIEKLKCKYNKIKEMHQKLLNLKNFIDEINQTIKTVEFKFYIKEQSENIEKILNENLPNIQSVKYEITNFLADAKNSKNKRDQITTSLSSSQYKRRKKFLPRKIKCPKCSSKNIKIGLDFKIHMIQHRKINKNQLEIFKCSYCPYKTKFKKYFYKHLLGNKKIKCKFCSIISKTSCEFRNHLEFHKKMQKTASMSKNDKECAKNGKECTKNKEDFTKYAINNQNDKNTTHDEETKMNFIPQSTNIINKLKSMLHRSFLNHHSNKIPTIPNNSSNIIETVINGTTLNYNYKQIQNTNHSIQQILLSNPFYPQQQRFFNPQIMNSQYPVIKHCNYCRFSAYNEFDMREHILNHHYIWPQNLNQFQNARNVYKCNFCPFTAPNVKLLMQHNHIHQINISKCTECNFTTSDKDLFKNHIAGHKLQCYYCNFTANCKEILDQHIQIWHERQPYKCYECGFCTNDRVKLNLHSKFQHMDFTSVKF
ncbi:hypothetical protein PVAND_001313 [Polypedilum vanderplanki]|uniref:C2H2-type domain-containing protein n=1 Tax=Polypedilum vanderplanki TaxID=319348 RepID=A0A9J6BNV6_POLVA|nr:hypothetical protein PVAND_001313 [Polypedilum vanderplanki]